MLAVIYIRKGIFSRQECRLANSNFKLARGTLAQHLFASLNVLLSPTISTNSHGYCVVQHLEAV